MPQRAAADGDADDLCAPMIDATPNDVQRKPQVRLATARDAPDMVAVIHAAFGARPALDPPSTADAETAESVAAAVESSGAVVAEIDNKIAGVILLGQDEPEAAAMRRVSVHPDHQRHGIGTAMVEAAEELATATGHRRIVLAARREFPDLVAYWLHRGYRIIDPAATEPLIVLERQLPLGLWADSPDEMRAIGYRLAAVLQPGDLIVANGQLGAGKTTLTQGLGAGLGAEGQIMSPTFVLSRVHATAANRPTLVHVDAYRLAGADELDDLDLDASLADAVTVVEWGRGIAEDICESRLEIDILRADDADESRLIVLRPVGDRWDGVDLASLIAAPDALRREDEDHG